MSAAQVGNIKLQDDTSWEDCDCDESSLTVDQLKIDTEQTQLSVQKSNECHRHIYF